MARPRQPIDLIEIKGKKHLTKKEIEERKSTEVSGNTDQITAPDYLDAKQKEQFQKIASELLSIGIMSNLDCDGLARYIIAETNYNKVTAFLKNYDISGDVKEYAKLVNVQDKFFKQCRASASDMGLTITSRCRLVVPKAKDEPIENKFLKFGGMSG